MRSVVEMAGPRNRKLAQPFTIRDLAGNQDHFLAFGVAGFCHGGRQEPLSRSTLLSYLTRLSRLHEAIGRQHAVQRLRDSAAVGRLLPQHDHKVFVIDQYR